MSVKTSSLNRHQRSFHTHLALGSRCTRCTGQKTRNPAEYTSQIHLNNKEMQEKYSTRAEETIVSVAVPPFLPFPTLPPFFFFLCPQGGDGRQVLIGLPICRADTRDACTSQSQRAKKRFQEKLTAVKTAINMSQPIECCRRW